MEELKQLAKTNPDFDEEPLKARAQHLISRRRDVSLILDDQNKFSIGIYHHLDQKIKDFGKSILCCSMVSAITLHTVLHYFALILLHTVNRVDVSSKGIVHLFPDSGNTLEVRQGIRLGIVL